MLTGISSSRENPMKECGMRSLSGRRLRLRWKCAPILALSLALAPRISAQGGEPQYFAIRGATVVPVSGPLLENATVIIARGVIKSVAKEAAIPDEAWVIDGKGLTVYPGLIDAFTHLPRIPIPAPAGGEGGARPQQP